MWGIFGAFWCQANFLPVLFRIRSGVFFIGVLVLVLWAFMNWCFSTKIKGVCAK